MSTVITVENLGKKYTISHQREDNSSLRDSIADSLSSFGKKLAVPFLRGSLTPDAIQQAPSSEDFWALKDVSFEVKQGDRIGIIGRNGAGKSTLLKILSRITEPTTGSIKIKGRVASLLEVGTGFHPELTGRENIYLNGAILGMKREEIRQKFDEIVDFAEIEKFLDTPVKRYSSGMYVRLAFAVAAHLEPEILIVDEVLAVGDAQFQKKCLGKMEDVSIRGGKTVLIVSHNVGILQQLCRSAILLDSGMITKNASIGETVGFYLAAVIPQSEFVVNLTTHNNRLSGMKSLLQKLSIKNVDGVLANNFHQRETILLEIVYDNHSCVDLAGAGFIIYSQEGVRVGGGNTYMIFMPPHNLPERGKVIFSIPARQFTPGNYSITVSLGSHPAVLEDKIEHAATFTVHQADIYGTGYLLTKEDGVSSLAFEAIVVPA